MSDPSLIADLIRAGLDPDLVARVSNAIASNVVIVSGGNRVDSTTEKRRAWDREYRRNRKLNPPESTRFPPDNAENALTIEDSKNKNLSKKERGERIPPDWLPSVDDLSFATSKGMSRPRLDIEAEKFRNYWTAKTGTAATKRDWPATWRNWVLSSLERSPGIPLVTRADTEPVWSKPPPGFKPIDEILRANGHAAANGTKIRSDSGLGETGRDQRPELPLPS